MYLTLLLQYNAAYADKAYNFVVDQREPLTLLDLLLTRPNFYSSVLGRVFMYAVRY